LNKMQKNLNLLEFFTNTKDKRLKTLKTQLLAGLFVNTDPDLTISDPVDFVIKELIENVYKIKRDLPAIMLTDLKGMGSIYHYHMDGIGEIYFQILQVLSTKAWVSFDNLYHLIRFNLFPLQVIDPYTAGEKLHYIDKSVEKTYHFDNKKFISINLYHEAISIPYLKGTFFLFAAMGLCDIAFDTPDRTEIGKTCWSAYDELKYVRLTPLGAFATGKSKTYEPAIAVQEGAKPVFSSEALTITLNVEDNAYEYMLKPYTNRVGPNRYTTDTATFLNGIKTKKELTNKINLFRQVTKTDFPPNWENFFTDMLQKINPFERVAEPLKLYKIPQDNKNLIKLIAQDAVLKSYVLKAEGFHILVPQSKVLAFKKRLLEFGYLLTK